MQQITEQFFVRFSTLRG